MFSPSSTALRLFQGLALPKDSKSCWRRKQPSGLPDKDADNEGTRVGLATVGQLCVDTQSEGYSGPRGRLVVPQHCLQFEGQEGKDSPGMSSSRAKRQNPPSIISPTLTPPPHLSKNTAAALGLHHELPWDLCQLRLLHQEPFLAGDLECLPKAPVGLHPHKRLA